MLNVSQGFEYASVLCSLIRLIISSRWGVCSWFNGHQIEFTVDCICIFVCFSKCRYIHEQSFTYGFFLFEGMSNCFIIQELWNLYLLKKKKKIAKIFVSWKSQQGWNSQPLTKGCDVLTEFATEINFLSKKLEISVK